MSLIVVPPQAKCGRRPARLYGIAVNHGRMCVLGQMKAGHQITKSRLRTQWVGHRVHVQVD